MHSGILFAMHDLPQQPPDYQVVLPVDQENSHGDEEYEFLVPPAPPMVKLEEKDLFQCAKFLRKKYANGFTWKELPRIIETTRAFVGPNPEMCPRDKRKACVEIIHYMMVSLDTLYLPEKAIDPFFEELIVPFVEVALAFPTERALIQPTRTPPLTDEALSKYAYQLKSHFEEEGLTWKNLSLATRYAQSYVLTYQDLTIKEQVNGAFSIVELVLSETPSSRLPCYYDEKLFKIFLRSFIKIELTT